MNKINNKYTYDYVKSYIESRGYELLSKEYINSVKNIQMKCPRNHIIEMRFGNFHNGSKCFICNGTPKHTYDYVKSFIENKGYGLLSTEYNRNSDKLSIKCDKEHIFDMTFNDFQQGSLCPDCNDELRGSYTRNSIEYIRNEIEKIDGYILLSTEYKSNKTKLKIRCNKGHIFSMCYNDFQQTHRCPKCNISGPEREIFEYIKSIYNGLIKPNDRDTITNNITGRKLELDIYLPELNKAIEYNGPHHYIPLYGEEAFKNQIIRDTIKKELCCELGIDLLSIDGHIIKWSKNKKCVLDQVKQFIFNGL
jgi:hypothetical protein